MDGWMKGKLMMGWRTGGEVSFGSVWVWIEFARLGWAGLGDKDKRNWLSDIISMRGYFCHLIPSEKWNEKIQRFEVIRRKNWTAVSRIWGQRACISSNSEVWNRPRSLLLHVEWDHHISRITDPDHWKSYTASRIKLTSPFLLPIFSILYYALRNIIFTCNPAIRFHWVPTEYLRQALASAYCDGTESSASRRYP